MLTPPAYNDESLAGYILRLASTNYYQSPFWILKLADFNKSECISQKFSPNQLLLLSHLIRCPLSELIMMRHRDISQNPNSNNQNKFPVKVCPNCLVEANYCRSIWNCEMLLACPKHQCLLVSKCPSCQKSLQWSRPGVQICQCGFDFCHHQPPNADLYQLLLSCYLYVLSDQTLYFQILEELYPKHHPIFELSLSKYQQFSNFFLPFVRAYLRYHQFSQQSSPIFTAFPDEYQELSSFELIFIFFQNWQNNFSQILLWYHASLQTLKTQQTLLKSMQYLFSSLYSYFPEGGTFHQFLASYQYLIET